MPLRRCAARAPSREFQPPAQVAGAHAACIAGRHHPRRRRHAIQQAHGLVAHAVQVQQQARCVHERHVVARLCGHLRGDLEGLGLGAAAEGLPLREEEQRVDGPEREVALAAQRREVLQRVRYLALRVGAVAVVEEE